MSNPDSRPDLGRPREAAPAAEPSYSDTPPKSLKPVFVVIGGLALIAAIVVGISLMPTAPGNDQPFVVPAATPGASEDVYSGHIVPSEVVVPEDTIWLDDLDASPSRTDSAFVLTDDLDVTVIVVVNSSTEATLRIEARRISTGEIIRNIKFTVVPYDPAAPAVITPQGGDQWRINVRSERNVSFTAVFSIDGKPFAVSFTRYYG